MRNRYETFCENEVEFPIEHLFKSITMMEPITELDTETNRLKKKLHKYFMKATKEAKGERTYQSLTYYPNGICNWTSGWHSGGDECILLEGFTTEYLPPEPEPIVPEVVEETTDATLKAKKPSKARRYPIENVLREHYPIWYMQIKEHMKRKNYKVQKYGFEYAYSKFNVYRKLDDMSKKMINDSHNFENQFSRVTDNIFTTFSGHNRIHHIPNYHNFNKNMVENDYKFLFLKEEEIPEILAICERARAKYHQNNGYAIIDSAAPLLEEFRLTKMKKDMKDRVSIDLFAVPTKAVRQVTRRYWDGESGEYVMKTDNDGYVITHNLFTELPKQMASIKDETIIKILTNMGLYVESMLPEVEEIEPEVVEVEIVEPEIEIISVSKSSIKDRAKHSEVVEVG
jgi:hypothetical protein